MNPSQFTPTGAASILSSEPLFDTDVKSLVADYQGASSVIRSMAWNLLQLPLTVRNIPIFAAFALAMDLLEGEESQEFHKGRGVGEGFPTREETIASFWRGHLGFAEGSLFAF